MSGFYGSLFVAFKETKIIGTSTIVGAILNIIINIALIKFIGLYAAVISTLLSNYIVTIIRKEKLKKYMHLENIDNYYFSILMLILVTCMYYMKTTLFNVVALLITIIYSLIANKDLIKDFKNLLNEKRKRS